MNKSLFFYKFGSLVPVVILVAGCQTVASKVKTWQPNAGPTYAEIEKQSIPTVNGLTVIDIDGDVARRANEITTNRHFSDNFAGSSANDYKIRSGDVVTVSLWEAPPALLFGSSGDLNGLSSSKEVKLPDQMVDRQGQITVPFVGKINVIGKSPQQVQDIIIGSLARKANKPSAIVGISKNNSSNVTVVGEVTNSVRMPLTGKGERVLDAIAAAGGTKYPSSKVTIQLNRSGRTIDMPMDSIINDARQNVVLQAGDVVSVSYQSKSFTVLGATVKNEEINFESNGISLMQALARAGGLNDNRADSRGVFLFRYESPRMLTEAQYNQLPEDFKHQPQVPVVYRLNLRDPMNFIIAQQFPVKNHDVIYVSNAPGAEFGKFLNMISQSIYSISTIRGLTN